MDIPVIYTTTKDYNAVGGGGSIKDSGSVASSTLSNWSASFRANFPFLVRHQQQYSSLTSAMMQQHRHRHCSTSDGYLSVDDEIDNDREEEERHHQAMEEKQNQISSCLHGNSNESVNLWQLRELALSKGGLCSSDLRKRAWPKLLATHDHVLAHYDEKYYSATTQSLARRFQNKQHKVSRKDALRIQQDIQHCMWHIEDHVIMARQQKELREKMIWMKQQQQNEKRRQVTFQDPPNLVSAESPVNVEQPQQHQGGGSKGKSPTDLPLEVTTTTTRSSVSTPKVRGVEIKHDDNDDDTYDIHSPMSAGGMMTPNSQNYYGSGMSLGSTSTTTTTAAKRKPTSAQEQQILYNVLSNVLKSLPSNEDDQHYRYFSGLHDLTALILINLESPSLTSLVVSKLVSYHLYGSLVVRRPNNLDEEMNPQIQPNNDGVVTPPSLSFKSDDGDTVLLKAVLPLLEMVDLELYQFLLQSGIILPSFCKSWIKCWFAQDVLDDIRVASRFIDVFLVSHVTMPIYVSVAMLTHPVNRSKILNSRCDLKSIYSTLKRLPTDLVLNEVHDPLDLVEDMIETALETLHTIPPSKLMTTVMTMMSKGATTISKNTVVLDAPPLWVLSSSAPTDYGLLQQAKAMRNKARGPALQEGDNDYENSNNSNKQEQELQVVLDEDNICDVYPLAATAAGLSKKVVATNKFITRRIVIFICLLGIALLGVQMSSNSKNTVNNSTTTLQKQQPLEGPSTTGIFRRKKSHQSTKSSPPPATITNKKKSTKSTTSTKLNDPKKTSKNSDSSRKKEEGERKPDTTTTKKEASPSSPSTIKIDTHQKDTTQRNSHPVMSSVLPTPSKVSVAQSSLSTPLNPTVKETKQEKPPAQQQQQQQKTAKAEKQSLQKSRKTKEVKELPKGKIEQPKKNKNILNKWFGARNNNKKKETNDNVSASDSKTINDTKKKKKKGLLSFFKRDKNKNKNKQNQQSDEKKKNDNMFSML